MPKESNLAFKTSSVKLGLWLKEMPKAKGGGYGGKSSLDGNRMQPSNPTPTLEDMGIEKHESSRYQKIAE